MRKPDIHERLKRTNAYNEERKSREYEQIQKALSIRREAEKFEAWKKHMKFEIALLAFQIVCVLEKQRDMNEPKNPDDDWNDAFCEAIMVLPEARAFAEDCWYDCVEVEGEIQH